ncbi:MAG: DNA topoisomerase [Clostridia bacterium]|nr:DNA topoisomerase [Clostridia bacterium]
MAKKNDYNNESITQLKGADRVRVRPAVILGSDTLDGCKHTSFEILANSIDEAKEGYGKEIIVTLYKDHSIEVEDFGRGVPVDYNPKEKRFNWELVYCELYAGGKIEGDSYGYSLGLNGLGACATQYSSRYMDVTVYRDGMKYSLHFERGENIGGLKSEPWNHKRTGTVTRWLPDDTVFTDINIEKEYFEDLLYRQSIVNAGIKLIFRYETDNGFETSEHYYERGIVDYIQEIVGDTSLCQPVYWEDEKIVPAKANEKQNKVKMTCCFAFSNHATILEYYHNSSYLKDGGSPDQALRTAFVAEFDAYLKNNGKYNKGESKITFADIADCLAYVSNCFSLHASFKGQTKEALTDDVVRQYTTQFLRDQLKTYLIENPMDAQKIAGQILINKRAREKSEKEKLNIKKTLSGSIDINNRIQKFVDCQTKDISRREVYIVEGDSALGACKQGRDSEFQAIIPVRGKILNCLKADYSRIFKSEIIVDLLKVLGCGVEIPAKNSKNFQTFNLDNLRWNKIVICTDADVDGFQIRTLILTMIYRLAPTLIKEGYVYIAESPLFEIINKTKKETHFAYTDAERDSYMKSHEGDKLTIKRSKGLGENEPDMMWQTTMNPETRRLVKILPDDAEATAQMFDILLGDNLEGRKEYIAENGYKYLDDVDLS